MRITLAAHNLFNQEYYWGGDTQTGGWADAGASRQIEPYRVFQRLNYVTPATMAGAF